MTEEEREKAIQKLKERKVYAHVYPRLSVARAEMMHYINWHRDKIKSVDYASDEIFCSNGDIHVFMNESRYAQWKLGRNYIVNGKWYRSGTELTR